MAEFKSVSIDSAKDFLTKHHWGVLATRRKDGRLQMSPITPGLDGDGRVIISSRETAYKVNNLRRDPAGRALRFHHLLSRRRLGSSQWQRGNHFSSGRHEFVGLFAATSLWRAYWPEFHARMVRERRVIIRFAIESVAPLRRGINVARSGSAHELSCRGIGNLWIGETGC